MKVLVTLKAEHYELPHHSYGVLAEIDWGRQQVVRSLKVPSASFRDQQGFMAPLVGGVCTLGRRVFMALWNFIIEIDYDSFEIVNAVSSPWMADLHGLATDGRYLYVTSTAVTTLLVLDIHSLAVVWQWGPQEPLLNQGQRPWWRTMVQNWRVPAGGVEFRHTHKSRSPHYRHHLNDVRCHQGFLYLTTLRWFGQSGGAVIKLDPRSRQATFLIPPGGVFGPHDGAFVGNRLVVTESAANGVAWRNEDGTIHRLPLQPQPAFVRGLCWTGHSFLVGFTRLRHSTAPSLIVEFDEFFQRELGRMDVSNFYPTEIGAAVHAITPAPREA